MLNEETLLFVTPLKGNIRKALLDTKYRHRPMKVTNLHMQVLVSNKILNK